LVVFKISKKTKPTRRGDSHDDCQQLGAVTASPIVKPGLLQRW
jgi:hypothetical protein